MRARRTHRYRRRPFSPAEPAIVAGEFLGRKLSELTDDELNRFLRLDARFQTKPASASLWTPPPSTWRAPSFPWCLDMSQYWFAKYELERREFESRRDPGATLNIAASDTEEAVARKFVDYGFRAASRKYHPDRGGDTATMQKVNAAIRFARDRLRS